MSKVCVVSGGGSGIGQAIALEFNKAGYTVAILGRHMEKLEETVKQSPDNKIIPFCVDVTNRKQVDEKLKEIATKLRSLDVLVNNAGTSGITSIFHEEDDLWEKILNTNLTGLFYLTRAFLRAGGKKSGARIVNIASILARFGVPSYLAYCTSKHGVIGFTRSLALELAPFEITVNAICPGWVNTDMAQEGLSAMAKGMNVSVEEAKNIAMEAVPQKRLLDPSEVSHLALYLASEQARGITGQSYNIACGQYMN